MNVGKLIKELNKYPCDMEIEIWGIYASSGIIEKVTIGENTCSATDERKVVVIESDICSG